MTQRVSTLAILFAFGACAPQGSAPSPTPVAGPPITTYDGAYAGDIDKIASGDPKICTVNPPSHKTLNVSNGHATIVGESDTRTGDVFPDGALTMRGLVRDPKYGALVAAL